MLGMRTGGKVILIPNPRDLPAVLKSCQAHLPQLPGGQHAVQRPGQPPGLQHRQLEEPAGFGGRRHGGARRRGQALAGEDGCPICEGYGLSETSPIVSCNPSRQRSFTGTIGVPLPSTLMKLLDDDGREVTTLGQSGEIAIKGPQVMAGYWQRPDETAKVMTEDGYFKSGHRGRDGCARLLQDRGPQEGHGAGQRLQRLPQRGGRSGGRMPGVLECAVVGVPDEKTGEAVKLVIVKKDPALTEAQVKGILQGQPHGLQAAQGDRVPHRAAQDPVGKILRRELRDKVTEGHFLRRLMLRSNVKPQRPKPQAPSPALLGEGSC